MTMSAKDKFATLFETKRRQAAAHTLVTALREATDLSMTLLDFLAAVDAVKASGAGLDGVVLGDVFDGLSTASARTPAPRGVLAETGAEGPETAAPMAGLARGVTSSAGEGVSSAPARIKGKVGRPISSLTAKRRDCIVAVLVANGDWMRPAEILLEVRKQKALFAEVRPVHLSQYLMRLAEERPVRVLKRGNRGASVYRAV
jgi:hypothetical protein